jgi:hypothetical protein
MAKDNERILYTVDKIPADLYTTSYLQNEVIARYLFRTRLAARKFAEKRNSRSRKFKYVAPHKAFWGPDK